MSPAVPGEFLMLGRYELHERIASGGMASVYLGCLRGAKGFARLVAIKRLHPQFALDADFASSFLDEARVASRIRHANVVPVTDVEAVENELFLVMDYVPGESLAALGRACAGEPVPVPVAIAARIMHDTLNGLQAAHDATDESGAPLRVIHRDVSPQNILVGVDGMSRLIDFGVAKAVGRLRLTTDGEVKGKLAYMSPEQLRGERMSSRADLYATGVILWELLTGRRLHDGESDAAVIVSVLNGDAPSLAGVAGVSDALADVVAHALRRDPLRRFGAARLMRDALDATCAPASHAEVSAWLHAKAHASLAQRASSAARVESAARAEAAARMESAPPVEAAPLIEAAAPVDVAAVVMPAWSQGGGGETALGETGLRSDSVPPVAASDSVARRAAPVVPRRPAQLRYIVTAAVAGCMLVLLAMVATGRRPQAMGPAIVEPMAPALGASTPPVPNALETDEGSIVADRSGDQTGVAVAPPQPPPAARRVFGATPTQAPRAHRSDPAPPRTSSSPPRANKCDPPFALDQGGRRIYKRECL